MHKKKRETPILNFRSDDFKWCIDNDFQVYPKLSANGKWRIAIRRGGISTEGKDMHRDERGVLLISHETLGKEEYKDINELSLYLPAAYKYLREKYGKKTTVDGKTRKDRK